MDTKLKCTGFVRLVAQLTHPGLREGAADPDRAVRRPAGWLPTKHFEHGEAALVADDRFPVDQKRSGPESSERQFLQMAAGTATLPAASSSSRGFGRGGLGISGRPLGEWAVRVDKQARSASHQAATLGLVAAAFGSPSIDLPAAWLVGAASRGTAGALTRASIEFLSPLC
jgi:hypothetical protein